MKDKILALLEAHLSAKREAIANFTGLAKEDIEGLAERPNISLLSLAPRLNAMLGVQANVDLLVELIDEITDLDE